MPFLTTHTYPLDCIQKMFNVNKHPFYNDIKEIQGNPNRLVNFIKYFLQNYDDNVLKLRNYTQEVHEILINRLRNENSLLEKILK